MSQWTPGTTSNRLQVKSNKEKERIICNEDTVYQNKDLGGGETFEKSFTENKGIDKHGISDHRNKRKKYENTPQKIEKIEITADEPSWI